jgi:hypothetical protein
MLICEVCDGTIGMVVLGLVERHKRTKISLVTRHLVAHVITNTTQREPKEGHTRNMESVE